MTVVRELKNLIAEAIAGWSQDRVASMGAALAYYAAFSLAPLLIIVVAIAGLVFGRDAALEALLSQIQGLIGAQGGAAIREIIENNEKLGNGLWALIIGIAMLVIGATTAFVELQDDLDRIWKVPPRIERGVWNLIRGRLLSIAMVLSIGLLLTVSLAVSAAVASLGTYLYTGSEWLMQGLTLLLSLAVVTTMFALIYKVLPNTEIGWANVWTGAAITAMLFEIGKLMIGLYLGKSSVSASFGAAGPFIVIMIWLYYSMQVFLFGAELTYAHAKARDPRSRSEASSTRILTGMSQRGKA